MNVPAELARWDVRTKMPSEPDLTIDLESVPRIVLTIEQAAEQLGVGRTMMYSLVRGGQVRSVCIGRLRRVPVAALAEYVAALLDEPRPTTPAA
jgi:excisionase family DNA binding protein